MHGLKQVVKIWPFKAYLDSYYGACGIRQWIL